MSVLPGPIRQIGYVVTDLDKALASWVELGVGLLDRGFRRDDAGRARRWLAGGVVRW